MEQITKGVRELIRVTMRERGIKHRSDNYHVHTVCYAEQTKRVIEYEGPIYITYDPDRAAVKVIAFKDDKPIRLERWDLRYHTITGRPVNAFDEIRIDIYRPDFCDVLGAFLDKHIKEHNKRPSKWKRQYKDTDQEYVFVPDEAPPKEESKKFTLGRMLVAWALRKWFNIDPYDLDFPWRHAVKRHFRIEDEELEQIEQTVIALRTTPKDEVEGNTKRILDGEWTEF